MVRLEEVEDETFLDKPESSKYDTLLEDDADYTDTGKSPPSLTYCAQIQPNIVPQ